MRAKIFTAAVLLLLAVPPAAFSLGLGDIRLKSALNAPLDAEIELLAATPEELSGLRPQLAPRDTFTRNGLEYPAFLSGITLRTVRASDGRNVIQLRSNDPITEPFATLLVEVNWARGRLMREYTVLLDPPVFAPNAARGDAAGPVAAPVTGQVDAGRSGAIAPAPAPAPVSRPAPIEPAATDAPDPAAGNRSAAAPRGSIQRAGESYEVRRGDTLSRIAASVAPASRSEQRQAMIAIYRSNPSAFGGNINELRSGAILRLPDEAAVAAVDSTEALTEVRRQVAAWQAARGAAEGDTGDARLRLVPPAETPAAPATPGAPPAAAAAGSSGAAEAQALRQRVQDLEAQLNESRRLIELRNAELAQLQARSAAQATAPPPATPPAVTPAPAPETPPAQAPAPSAAAPAAPAPAGGIVETLKTYWYVPAAVLALFVILGILRTVRSRREASFEDSLGRLAGAPSARDFSSDTLPLRKPIMGEESFLVEETAAHERPSAAGMARSARKVAADEPAPADSSLVSDTAIGLEQGDPLAEADFHMAYGLYDQAADLVRLAITRDPRRRDLKLKLLEVFFVWGNREQFLTTARELAASREQAQPGEWEKIVIMGKQLAPDDALFSKAGSAGAAVAGVDLNLEGGQNRVDFDLLGEPSVETTTHGGVDLDLGTALGQSDETTGESTGLGGEGLDFTLDDPSRGGDAGAGTATTRQLSGIDDDAGAEAPTLHISSIENEGPTIEQPQLRGDGATIREKVDIARRYTGSAEQTAELALDDLGLDLGQLEVTGDNNQGLEASGEAPTLVAGLDDESRRLMDEAERTEERDDKAENTGILGATTESGTWLFSEQDFVDPQADTVKPEDAAPDATTAMPTMHDSFADGSPTAKLRAVVIDDLDVDFDRLAATGANPKPAGSAVEFDVGAAGPGSDFAPTQRIGELTMPDLEPATMSEVGTKLDLARAYMDMGDPEGARSILQEVLEEGSIPQKQEAQRLIDSIPG